MHTPLGFVFPTKQFGTLLFLFFKIGFGWADLRLAPAELLLFESGSASQLNVARSGLSGPWAMRPGFASGFSEFDCGCARLCAAMREFIPKEASVAVHVMLRSAQPASRRLRWGNGVFQIF